MRIKTFFKKIMQITNTEAMNNLLKTQSAVRLEMKTYLKIKI